MVNEYLDKYTFLCEMYEEGTERARELTLHYYPFDRSVRLVDAARGLVLLRRVHLPGLALDTLRPGSVVSVLSRLLLITDCAPATSRTLLGDPETTFALIKPMPLGDHGKVLTYITSRGFRIVRMRSGRIGKELALDMYRDVSGSSVMPKIVDYVSGGEVIGLELVAPDAVRRWRACLGATDPRDAAPGTLRRLYGEDVLRNVAHGCRTRRDADRMLDAFFGRDDAGVPRIPFRATFRDCTCCVIKPHAVLEGLVGAILEWLSSAGHFYVAAMAMFSVSVPDAREFYEVYRGVVPEYEAMALQLAEGRCVALEVKRAEGRGEAVRALREACGPRDPALCRQLYPGCLRALYGTDLLHNAVHCTDLPEDGVLEVEYFFKLLANN